MNRTAKRVFVAKSASELAKARVPQNAWIAVYEDTPQSRLLCVGRPGRKLGARVKERCRSWPVVARWAETKEELLRGDTVRNFGWRPDNRLMRPRTLSGRLTRGRKPMKAGALFSDPGEGVGYRHRPQRAITEHDVMEWLVRDPGACITAAKARRVLRGYVSSFHPWTKATGENIKQRFWWWKSLRVAIHNLSLEISPRTVVRYASCLAGYIVFLENEQIRTGPMWRAFKRSSAFKRIGILASESPAAEHPTREHLKIRLCELMTNDALHDGWKLNLIPEMILNPVWALVGEDIKPGSLARNIRRSRARKTSQQRQ